MKKQAATAQGKMTIGNLLNTMVNPFASIMPGEYYMPTSLQGKTQADRDAVPVPFTGNPKYDKILFHGGAIGVTALTVAALARYISQRQQDKRQEKLDAAEVVSATNPIFSPDPYLGDTEEEQQQQLIGFEKQQMQKKAEIDLPHLESWLKVIIPLSFMVGGGVAGYKGMDNFLERTRKKRYDEELAQLSNEYDRLNYIKLMKARGASPEDIPPPGQEAMPMPEFEEPPGPLPKAAMYKKADDDATEESGWDAVTSLSALVLLSTAVTSGILTKRYFDEQDPKRIEFNEMAHALKQLKTREAEKAPVDIAPIPLSLQQSLDKHLTQPSRPKRIAAPAAIESPELPARTIEATPVDIPSSGISRDITDPTMAIL